jgi:excinuclease UvrABC nuclease subunit
MTTGLPLIQEVDWPPYRIYADRQQANCWVYEVWDDHNRLAYVGIADDFDRRWQQHASRSWWLSEIHVGRVFVTGYRSRTEARYVEAETIHDQSPIYNTNLEQSTYRRYRAVAAVSDDTYCTPVRKRYFKGGGSYPLVQNRRRLLVTPENTAAI